MIRKLKVLSLALGAVFAIGAMMASTASATDLFTNAAGKGTDLMTGFSHNNHFSVAGGNGAFSCTTSKFAATAEHGKSTITAEAVYTGTTNVVPHTETHCSGTPGTQKITVEMNECDYDLTGNTTQEDKKVAGKKDAVVWITCPAGKEIKVVSDTLGVTVSVPEQTSTEGGVTYTNLKTHSGGESIEVNATVTGLTYTCSPAFSCNLGGIPTEANDGIYTGTVQVTCWEDKNAANKPITPASEGARTGCSVS